MPLAEQLVNQAGSEGWMVGGMDGCLVGGS